MDSSEKITLHVSAVTIAVNIILSIFKVLTGIIAHSTAMISDAVHSASDVISTLIVIIGARASGKSSDEKHPYGHERMECVASIILAVILFLTGVAIGADAFSDITTGIYRQNEVPGLLALIASVISIAVKEWMFHYTKKSAVKINSTILMADAWHHRSDALSSVGALAGIALSIIGYQIADSIASILICVLIAKVAYDIFKEACAKMVDTATDKETEEKMREIILSVDGVIEINLLTTRLFGSKMYVDVEISVDASMSLIHAHDIAETVHNILENQFETIKHCMVHVNPYVDKLN